jgi:hypothetical protein
MAIRDESFIRRAALTSTSGALLASEQEAVRKLDAEMEEQIRALLTPAELATYELARTREFHTVRDRLRYFAATEEEFESIVLLEKELAPWIERRDGTRRKAGTGPEVVELHEGILALLGEERYAEFVRATDREYMSIRRLTDRASRPVETANEAYALRASGALASQRIAGDASLTREERNAAIADLAGRTRGELRRILGSEVADAYLEPSDSWMETLDRGVSYEVPVPGARGWRQ